MAFTVSSLAASFSAFTMVVEPMMLLPPKGPLSP
jgi:hypothetical protein